MRSQAQAVFQPSLVPGVRRLFEASGSVVPRSLFAPEEAPRLSSVPAGPDPEVEEARKQGFDAGLAEGEQRGHQRGLEKGREIGRREAASQLAGEVEAVESLAASLAASRDGIVPAMQAQAIELGLAIAERILASRLADHDVLTARLAEVMAALGVEGNGEMTVRAAPASVKVLAKALAGHTGVKLVADATIAAGDLVVEAGGNSASSIAAEQLARIAEVVRGG